MDIEEIMPRSDRNNDLKDVLHAIKIMEKDSNMNKVHFLNYNTTGI